MENQKLANFSVAPNGVSKNTVLGKKQGTEKKVLAIKNFKGKILGKFSILSAWYIYL